MEKIPYKDLEILYSTDFHDGLVAGICKYKDNIYYLDCWDFDYGGWEKPTNIEIKSLMPIIKNPTAYPNTKVQECGAINIYRENTLYIYYRDSKYEPWSVCRPRKYYIYKLSKWELLIEKSTHSLFINLVIKFPTNVGKKLWYNFISYTKYLYREKYNRFRAKRTRYHKNKIIGWTED